MIIYMATNLINNKKYIGQTTQTLALRKNQHERAYKYSSSKNNAISRAIHKYGKENFSWKVIDKADTIQELNDKEEYWIAFYDTLKENGKGYNIKKGGNNHKHSQRTKKLIGMAQLGANNHMYGKIGKDNPTSKKVFDVYENIIYDSATECAKANGIDVSKICSVCRGERGSAKKKVFRYIDDDGLIIEPQKKTSTQRHRIVNVDTGEIFESAKQAVLSKGKKSYSHILEKLKSGLGVCFMYDTLWCYEGVDENIISEFKNQQQKNKKHRPNAYLVKELKSGMIFDSISDCAKTLKINKGNLAHKLKKYGKYVNNEYAIIKI